MITSDNIKIYVVTCDNYLWLLKPFCYLFNKYWGENKEVVILGYKRPDFELPLNFKFESMGVDLGSDDWTTGLINYIKNTKESHFILTLEDLFLTGPVDFEKMSILLNYCNNNRVGRICLHRDTVNREHQLFEKIDDDFSIIEAKQSVNFRVSTQWSVWKKDYFLDLIETNTSPWSFEEMGSRKAMNDGFHILGTKSENGPPDNSAIDCTNALWRGQGLNFGKVNYPHLGHDGKLEYEVIKEMKDKNIIPKSHKCGVVYERQWRYYDE